MLTAVLYLTQLLMIAMCHCFGDVTELSDAQRNELLEEHTIDELKTELSAAELEALGVAA